MKNKITAFDLMGNGRTIRVNIHEVTNSDDAQNSFGNLILSGWTMLPDGNPLNWLEFLEEHEARTVEQSDRDSKLVLFAKTSSERDEVLVLKIPEEFKVEVPKGSDAFVVTVSKPLKAEVEKKALESAYE